MGSQLIVGPTNSGKSRFVVDQIYGPFRFKFDNYGGFKETYTFPSLFFHLQLSCYFLAT